MDLLVSASFVASFFAGVASLFAPCCITVLLPSYLASIFKQKTTIFFMTFVYFLGLLAVFLPIGFGATFLSTLFSTYHNVIFLFGGIFLLLLGGSMVLGIHLPLPSPVHPSLKRANVGSVFVLGVFSAIATTCCAPVLAGVVALSILPGSVVLGVIYTLAYVLGMVFPLFILATFLDHTKFTQKVFMFRKTVKYTLFGKTITASYSELFSGVLFFALGSIVTFLAVTNRLFAHAAYQMDINIALTRFIQFIGRYTRVLPEPVWAGVFVVITIGIVVYAIRIYQKETKRKE
ncbi:MAG TPA: hypothetical protein DCX25_00780 [Candidatus Pacebacteria bacterium]|nr:MAG: Cytochrome c biogenesis protein, transmembrane region [Microgenomates group bacterium GW2011_GWB1_45_17]KKU23195.1 MAG: Cytochrome c biogenesis protein, transmembrane region [Microgenomates group bacterium GW2011_GWA1_46_15]KKU24057.1 MAG: Cytochrome c biogenesis protein, transmembrane region [Microgenomates group bacterium GW2011_GWC1_46_15]HAV14854.1 hypothetical protein [Candidatus Paceibacterota bacterium]HCR11245.1 hypothetical protein [Candidatus Paceibacterota bacterium]